ncbi:hypothetical protein FRB90_001220 [Tulasnella sp. 427]|nr:hypothetical protein FRB90_001220 [Tulasnella sp. 427]
MISTKYNPDGEERDYVDIQDHGLIGNLHTAAMKVGHPLQNWLVRRVEVIRGSVPIRMECAPAFNYARDEHTMEIVDDDSISPLESAQQKVVFKSKNLAMDLRYVIDTSTERQPPDHAGKTVQRCQLMQFEELDLREKGHLGLSAVANFTLSEGNVVTFILRDLPQSSSRGHPLKDNVLLKEASSKEEEQEAVLRGASALRPNDDPLLTADLANELLEQTNHFWTSWINRSTYTGLWREAVHRSALALKLLTYEPTGAIVASPTFSLPEFIGGTRNWDYRASWIRDASFTLYALIRLGFTEEANAYMEFIYKRLEDRNPDGSLQIMYTIHGGRDLPEFELDHLEGHKESRPVRIGNGAADHLQLDIYGELMDCIYLSNKFGRPIGYDVWVSIREMIEYVIRNYKRKDLSIWEVRSAPQNFVYSKVMMWVAIDRGLRLADKRSFPCPRRNEWLQARDELYEEIMTKGWNKEKGFFGQSYENLDVLDASLLDFLGFGNHCGLFSEEISAAGEGLGNAVQGFTHVTLISAAYNLSRTLGH